MESRARTDAGRRGPRRGERAFTLLELLVVVAIVGILAAIAVPMLLGGREKARTAACDGIFVSLDAAIANDIESAHDGLVDTVDPPVMYAIKTAATYAAQQRNPRNRNQPAYAVDASAASCADADRDSCQVIWVPLGPTAVAKCQDPTGDGNLRTARITIN